jgi:protein phosphatase 1 regulatory subunit 7
MKPKANRVEVIDIGIGRIAWVSSSNLDRCREMLAKNELDGLGIAVSLGFDLSSIQELADIAALNGLCIGDVKGVDTSSLSRFVGLRFLKLMYEYEDELDLAAMHRLHALSVNWSPRIKWPIDTRSLKNLWLQKYKPSSETLAELETLSALEVLQVAQGTVKSLAGIEGFPKLSELQLHYLPRLETVKDIAKTSVDRIIITHCKKITDLASVAGCKSLRVLRYHDSAPLRSIAFVNDCPNLTEFRFVGVDVIDGDLTPLKRLDEFAFTQKKHFSHTEKELLASRKSRVPGPP